MKKYVSVAQDKGCSVEKRKAVLENHSRKTRKQESSPLCPSPRYSPLSHHSDSFPEVEDADSDQAGYITPPASRTPTKAPPTQSRHLVPDPESSENIPFRTSPTLFLGPIGSTKNSAHLVAANIRHIFHFHDHESPLFPIDGVQRYFHPIEDEPHTNILPLLDTIVPSVRSCLTESPEAGVLFSCRQGISRSGTVLFAVLMDASFDPSASPAMVNEKVKTHFLKHRDDFSKSSVDLVIEGLLILREEQKSRVPEPRTSELIAPNSGFLLQLSLKMEAYRTEKPVTEDSFAQLKDECLKIIKDHAQHTQKTIYHDTFEGITGYDSRGYKTVSRMTHTSFYTE